jgi:hypothetical protein
MGKLVVTRTKHIGAASLLAQHGEPLSDTFHKQLFVLQFVNNIKLELLLLAVKNLAGFNRKNILVETGTKEFCTRYREGTGGACLLFFGGCSPKPMSKYACCLLHHLLFASIVRSSDLRVSI